MATTNTKTVNVPLDDIYNTEKLQTNFNTQATFNSEFNQAFGSSEQYDNIKIQTQTDTNFLNITNVALVLDDSIGIDTLNIGGKGSLRLDWLSETQTIDELDEIALIDDIDDIDEIDDLDLDLFYEIETSDIINKEEFKDLLQTSGISISDELVDKIFDFFDKDENETLDYNDVSKFIRYVEQRRLTKLKFRKEKVKNVVNIDSRYRSNYYDNTSTSFDYNLPEPQLDVTNIRVSNVDIPMTQYTVSSKLKNNSFLITSNANTIKIQSDISSHWRLQMQIGDISSDWLHGTVFEDVSYTSIDVSNANDFAGGTPSHDTFWNGPSFSTTNDYDTPIVPIETVTFEVSVEEDYNEEDSSGTMLDFYADPSNNKCGLGNPSTNRCLFPRSRTVPLLEQSIRDYRHPPGDNYWGDPWGAYSTRTLTIGERTINRGDAYPKNTDGNIIWGWFPPPQTTTSTNRIYDSNHPNPSRPNASNTLYEYGIEHQQLIFPDPSSVPFGHVPYTKTCTSQSQISNDIRTISKTTTYVKKYSFLKLTYQKWQSDNSFWNGKDGNYTQTNLDPIDVDTNPWFTTSDNNQDYASRKWLLHTEINYKGLVKNQRDNKAINPWFPRGNPNRTDISFEHVKYYNNDDVEYPYDCSGIHETTSTTTVTKEIHLRSYTFIRLSDGKEMSLSEFIPVNFAWLVKVPDGNYDESLSNLNRNERVVNDAISVATPGAVDIYGNFAAIKSPQHYLYLNLIHDDKFAKTRKFIDSRNKSLRISGITSITIPDIRYTVDRLTKKSVFASESSVIKNSSGNLVNIDFIETTNFKFLTRTGQSSLRTVKEDLGDEDSVHALPSGKQYKEMVLMQNVARQPVTKVHSLPTKLLSSIKFNVDEFGNQDNETNIQHKLGWVLGFRAAEYLL